MKFNRNQGSYFLLSLILIAATGYYFGFEARIFHLTFLSYGLRYDKKFDFLLVSTVLMTAILIFRSVKNNSGISFKAIPFLERHKNKLLVLCVLLVAGTSVNSGFQNNEPRVFNILNFGGNGNGKRITGVSMGATSTTLTGSGFTSADVGKAIRVPGAGSSGHDLVTTIAAFTNSTTITLTAPSVGAVSADTVVYGSDNTNAIQVAVWADSLNGGGLVWVPNGVFCTAGSLVTSAFGANPNSQIYFPSVTLDLGLYRRTHYVIQGETPPNYAPNFFADSLTQLNGSIIYSLIDGSGNLPAVFGIAAPLTSFGGISYNYITFRNLTILVAQNRSNNGPSIGGINMYYSGSLITENVLVTSDGSVASTVKPTNEVAGIVYNRTSSEIQSVCTNTQVETFKYGLVVSDDALITNGFAIVCQYGLVMPGQIENIQVNHMKAYWCNASVYIPNATIGGYIAAGTTYFNITNLVAEVFNANSGSWYDYVKVVDDAGNRGVGNINYTIIQAGGTYANNLFNKSGGTGIICTAIGSGTLATPTQVPLALGGFYNQNNYMFSTSGFGVQAISFNNTLISNNTHFDGSAFRYDTTGFASWLQFANGSIVGRTAVSGTTAGAVTPINSFSYNPDLSGGIGGNGTVLGSTNYWLNWTTAGFFTPKTSLAQDFGSSSLLFRDIYARGIVGVVTNSNAQTGSVGEYVSSLVAIGSPVSLSNGIAANITSISLTAGDWDVDGQVSFTETTSTVTGRSAGVTSTTATVPVDGSEAYCGVQSTVTSETNSISLVKKRFSLSGTTTVFLVGKASFSAGTCGGFGVITARRVR